MLKTSWSGLSFPRRTVLAVGMAPLAPAGHHLFSWAPFSVNSFILGAVQNGVSKFCRPAQHSTEQLSPWAFVWQSMRNECLLFIDLFLPPHPVGEMRVQWCLAPQCQSNFEISLAIVKPKTLLCQDILNSLKIISDSWYILNQNVLSTLNISIVWASIFQREEKNQIIFSWKKSLITETNISFTLLSKLRNVNPNLRNIKTKPKLVHWGLVHRQLTHPVLGASSEHTHQH